MPLIEITLIEGRDPEKIRMLLGRITDVVEATLDAPRQSIRVVVREVKAAHWAVGGEPKG